MEDGLQSLRRLEPVGRRKFADRENSPLGLSPLRLWCAVFSITLTTEIGRFGGPLDDGYISWPSAPAPPSGQGQNCSKRIAVRFASAGGIYGL